MDNKDLAEKIQDGIEKHRIWIGAFLLVFILIGGSIILWRENWQKPKADAQAQNYESRIEELEKKLEANDAGVANAADVSSTVTGTTSQSAVTTGKTTTAKSSTSVATKSPTASSTPAKTGQATTSVPASAVFPININTATLAQFDALPGIGEVKAQAIIDYRTSHGSFTDITQLKNVKGIGDATFDKLKADVTI